MGLSGCVKPAAAPPAVWLMRAALTPGPATPDGAPACAVVLTAVPVAVERPGAVVVTGPPGITVTDGVCVRRAEVGVDAAVAGAVLTIGAAV